MTDLPGFLRNSRRMRGLSGPDRELVERVEATERSLVEYGTAAAPDQGVLDELTGKMLKALEPLDRDTQVSVLRDVSRMQRDAEELAKSIATGKDELREMENEFLRMMPAFLPRWEEAKQRSRQAPLPPPGNTPSNVEAAIMAFGYTFEPLWYLMSTKEDQLRDTKAMSDMCGYYTRKDKAVAVEKIMRRYDAIEFHNANKINISMAAQNVGFAVDWLRSGFPKLEIGHKLAASLAMTDVPDDIEVLAPWKAWSLIIPPGIWGTVPEGGVEFARFLCVGAQIRYVIDTQGRMIGPLSYDLMLNDNNPRTLRLTEHMMSLVRGCCLALSNPDDYKKQRMGGSSPKKSQRSSGAPDFSATRFMLSAPVQIDLRQHLADTIAGKKHGGGAPSVQFFVRGHWRNQAHGPGRSLRKQIRIEGFWKGDEDARVLLRNYKTKTE